MEPTGLQNQGPTYQPMSIGDWLITFLITAIPFVGFIMFFVWAFGDGTHPSKKTWAGIFNNDGNCNCAFDYFLHFNHEYNRKFCRRISAIGLTEL